MDGNVAYCAVEMPGDSYSTTFLFVARGSTLALNKVAEFGLIAPAPFGDCLTCVPRACCPAAAPSWVFVRAFAVCTLPLFTAALEREGVWCCVTLPLPPPDSFGTYPCIHLFCRCPVKTDRVELACAIDSADTGPLSILRLFGEGPLTFTMTFDFAGRRVRSS